MSLATIVLFCVAFAACRTERQTEGIVPYTSAVKPVLDAQCVRCHADPAPAAGVRVDSYLGAIGCTSMGTALTVAPSGPAPLVAVLDRSDHAGFASAAQRTTIGRWIATGTSRGGGG